ncbi:MAG: hypothetical protein HOV80_32700 [Polyangiaceae bacterium]|nr:hypothetical protein [Polyangiaceae bacterium]
MELSTKTKNAGNEAERRRKRSDDPVTALHYQLAAVRREASLDAVVLADAAGILVAGAGAWPACEELAAYAPLLATSQPVRRTVSARLDALRESVESLSFEVLGSEVLLSCRGGMGSRAEALARAAAGVRRILDAA